MTTDQTETNEDADVLEWHGTRFDAEELCRGHILKSSMPAEAAAKGLFLPDALFAAYIRPSAREVHDPLASRHYLMQQEEWLDAQADVVARAPLPEWLRVNPYPAKLRNAER